MSSGNFEVLMVKSSCYGLAGVNLCCNWKEIEGEKGVRPKIDNFFFLILGTFGYI